MEGGRERGSKGAGLQDDDDLDYRNRRICPSEVSRRALPDVHDADHEEDEPDCRLDDLGGQIG